MAETVTDYQIVFSKKAQKDITQLTSQQKAKLQEILQQVITINPQAGKRLKGNLSGFYSYRLNQRDRLVYEIIEDTYTGLIIRAKTYYGD